MNFDSKKILGDHFTLHTIAFALGICRTAKRDVSALLICILASCSTVFGLGTGPPIISPKIEYNAEVLANMRAQLAAEQKAAQLQQEVLNFVPRDPWRHLDGVTNYVKPQGVEFCGKVMDITPHGIRVQGQFGALFATSYSEADLYDYSDFFIANYPYMVVQNQVIQSDQHLMAWFVGTYTYTTVGGGSRTIYKLDYGFPCGPPPELIAQQIEAAKQYEIQHQNKVRQSQTNAVKWLQLNATNGSASAQFSLGLHYLNGVGCESNRQQAVFWLNKAAAQGDMEASNKLVSLKEPQLQD